MHSDPQPTTPADGQPTFHDYQGGTEPGTTPMSYPPDMNVQHTSHAARKKGWPTPIRVLGEVVAMLAVAAIIALILRAFVVQVYKIPSESMMDTMQVGSRIAVNHVPVIGTQVERGDIIVFRDTQGWLEPVDEQGQSLWSKVAGWFGFAPQGSEQIVVKRVIAVGGDTVECCDADGRVVVNGVGIDEPYLAHSVSPSDTEFSVVVPENSYWVMGDNRANSADSRFHHNIDGTGFVPASSVIGKAQWEIWPIDRWSTLGNREVFQDVPSPNAQ